MILPYRVNHSSEVVDPLQNTLKDTEKVYYLMPGECPERFNDYMIYSKWRNN